MLRVLRAEIGAQVERGYGPLRTLPTDERSLLRLFQDSLGWGPAQPYLDDERIQEVKIVGDLIMVQEVGADFTLVPERFADPRQALDRAMLLAARLNVPLDRTRPQDTLPLAHGTRMHVTIPPCTPEDTALICIRRGRRHAWSLDDILRREACSPEVGALLRLLVRAGCSFLIAGETGCGKTALLEAIVNSWPGEPHVVTIEDNTLEINVRHRAWTRELVQTAVERGAFGRAAREVLRQTPSLVAPGETRAEEAGAILAVAVSGHAVVTTIHARSAARAVQRFADCAAMPGAYIYEGRREHALEDACDNFQVIIHLEKLNGRRSIDEILLLDGADTDGERVRPRLLRLAWAEPAADGALSWQAAASADGDSLRWDGEDRTPAVLARRLRQLRLQGQVRAATTTRAAVAETVARAERAISSGDASQALAMLRRAWRDQPAEPLAAAARRAIELDLALSQELATQARALEAELAAALGARRWREAGNVAVVIVFAEADQRERQAGRKALYLVPPTDRDEHGVACLQSCLIAAACFACGDLVGRDHRVKPARRVDHLEHRGRHQPHALATDHLTQHGVRLVVMQLAERAGRAEPHRYADLQQGRVEHLRRKLDLVQQRAQWAREHRVARDEIGIVGRLALDAIQKFTQRDLSAQRGEDELGALVRIAVGCDLDLGVAEALAQRGQRPTRRLRPLMHEAADQERSVGRPVPCEEFGRRR